MNLVTRVKAAARRRKFNHGEFQLDSRADPARTRERSYRRGNRIKQGQNRVLRGCGLGNVGMPWKHDAVLILIKQWIVIH